MINPPAKSRSYKGREIRLGGSTLRVRFSYLAERSLELPAGTIAIPAGLEIEFQWPNRDGESLFAQPSRALGLYLSPQNPSLLRTIEGDLSESGSWDIVEALVPPVVWEMAQQVVLARLDELVMEVAEADLLAHLGAWQDAVRAADGLKILPEPPDVIDANARALMSHPNLRGILGHLLRLSQEMEDPGSNKPQK